MSHKVKFALVSKKSDTKITVKDEATGQTLELHDIEAKFEFDDVHRLSDDDESAKLAHEVFLRCLTEDVEKLLRECGNKFTAPNQLFKIFMTVWQEAIVSSLGASAGE